MAKACAGRLRDLTPEMSMLHTASFYEPENWVGRPFRVSRAHPRGRKTLWDILPFFYPERRLLDSYREGSIGFTSFGDLYRSTLDTGLAEDADMRHWVQTELLEFEEITLLCFEREGQPCHRLVLARWLMERQPGLELGHLR